MRLKDHGTGFTLWISAPETRNWARNWPCSTLVGRRIRVDFDRTGMVDLRVNGRYPSGSVDAWELSAIVADYSARRLSEDHPAYYVAVGQFLGD